MTDSAPVGLLLMNYGSPASLDEVEPFYTHIRRGRPPEPEQLADLVARYEAIGGVDTLRARTRAQGDAIAAALDDAAPDHHVLVHGAKHADPFIEDAVAELAVRGVERIVGLVLAPHFSRGSVGQYLGRAATSADEAGIPFTGIERWWDLPAHLDFLAREVRAARARAREATGRDAVVVFTAHSLPLRVLEDDPYEDELRAGAAAVADRLGLGEVDWMLGWQSAGRTPEPWAGPDILEIIAEVGRPPGGTGDPIPLVVCPHGFVADHLEVRYDLDIEATAAADDVGVSLHRTGVVNDDPAVMSALAALVRRTGAAGE